MMKSHTPPGRNSKECVVVVKPFGLHQWARCLISDQASQTRRRGPSTVRDTTISRSEIAGLLLAAAMSLLLSAELPYVFVETVECFVPILLETACPFMDRLEAPGVEAIESLSPRSADVHEPYLAKHAEVL
jgi:hypothetical protein